MTPEARSPEEPTGAAQSRDLSERARVVLDTLAGLEPELRAAAVLSEAGEVLASTLDDEDFGRAAVEFAGSLEASGPGDLDSSHVASEEAEVFLVSESGISLVAVTERFVLASLTSFDVRMSLRDLSAGVGDA